MLFILAADGRDDERLNRLAEELARDLREIPGVAVTSATSPVVPGTKSGIALAIGQLAVSGGALSAAALVIRGIVEQFLNRNRATSVTVRNGDREVTIERPTDTQVDEIVDQLRDLLAK
ncbi:effector-associated constant component EACC1 [Nocardia aurantia]|uniref:effector-associated constant component EACC1 n=1 Tax=Nocardia aurantia TaxID=2585199 RepID=UPI0029E7EE62|nr:hypothetical protein [Nocardia aurantia]